MESLKNAEARLVRLERWILTALVAVIVLTAFGQVALRQLARQGILWGDTFLRHLVLWVGFLGAALAAAEGKHFAWELPGRDKTGPWAWVYGVAWGAACLTTACLAKAAWNFWMEDYEAGDILFTAAGLEVPAWLFSSAIPLGFLLVFFHMLVRIAEFKSGPKTRA